MAATNRVLILFAHPALEKSRVHRSLIRGLDALEGVTFHDLYETYPDLHINVAREQELLRNHDVVVLQHPFYWYSAPAIVKEWQDLVLEYGFAYGENGSALSGKKLISAISTGGPADSYQAQGFNRFTIRQLLLPFEQTAHLCGMEYLPPFVIHGTHKLSDPEIDSHAADYLRVILGLRDGQADWAKARDWPHLNLDLSAIFDSPLASHA